ncbi:hypothetical protein Hdeb2414_s0003g00082671 [Helianthus debilis subsp. tardiflorus]
MGKELKSYNLNFETMIKGELGNGRDIRFWLDWWVGMRLYRFNFQSYLSLKDTKELQWEKD